MSDHVVDWIQVDESKYSEARPDEARSVRIEMSVSPYNVPQQVRGQFDSAKRMFVIDFQYIDDEPTRHLRVDDHVVASVGRKSGRVYSLAVDVDALKADSVRLCLNQDQLQRDATGALEALKRGRRMLLERVRTNAQNYDLAERVLGDYWPSIRGSEALAAR